VLLPHGAIVAVVDGRNLELFRNGGTEAEPDLTPMAAPKLDEHIKDSGGRHNSSAANPAAHQLDEDAHAAAVAAWLNEQVVGHKIRQLVIIAAPRTLGELRKRYGKQLEAALLGELHKELSGRSGSEILAALRGA
jgi:protein required for attachment to host cells